MGLDIEKLQAERDRFAKRPGCAPLPKGIEPCNLTDILEYRIRHRVYKNCEGEWVAQSRRIKDAKEDWVYDEEDEQH